MHIPTNIARTTSRRSEVAPQPAPWFRQTLAQGASGPAVSALQATLGMNAAGRTGTFGPTTKHLVQAFQRRSGLAPDGVVGPKTRTALEDQALARAMKDRRVLRQGASGPHVVAMQRLLGFGPGGQTGVMGPSTVASLAKRKTALGLGDARAFGPTTFAAMTRRGGPAAARLVGNIQALVGGNTIPGGQCYKYVADALEGIGVRGGGLIPGGTLWGMSAYQAAGQLAGNANFRELNGLAPDDLPKLPAGAIVVWGPRPGQAATHDGHISVALGDGREASDFIAPQSKAHHTYGTSFRVFMPTR